MLTVYCAYLIFPILLAKPRFSSSVSIHPTIRLVSKIGEPCGLVCALLMSQMRKLVSHPNPHRHYMYTLESRKQMCYTRRVMNTSLLAYGHIGNWNGSQQYEPYSIAGAFLSGIFYNLAFLPTKMARLIIHVESTALLNWDTANQLGTRVTEVRQT